MKPRSIMIIAGDPSGDRLAAELVLALRRELLARSAGDTDAGQPLATPLAPRFCGAGGSEMAAAGVEIVFDLTKFAVIGITDVIKKVLSFRRLFHQLRRLAIERQPDVIIGVDFSGFNLRFAEAIKRHVRRHRREFVPWNPRIVQFVLPQVWASRAWRAYKLSESHDLLLGIIPFEEAWYAQRVPGLNVEFVGHPMVDRFSGFKIGNPKSKIGDHPLVLLLPGSRAGEVKRHGPLVAGAFELVRRQLPTVRGKMVLPNETLAQTVRGLGVPAGVEVQVGGMTDALAAADLAITKSGTVTLECAMFGVPAVVFYQVSLLNYLIARQFVTVKYLALPNLLAGAEVFPEFIQNAATPSNLARAALTLLRDEARRHSVLRELAKIVASLGAGGATTRAAKVIADLL